MVRAKPPVARRFRCVLCSGEQGLRRVLSLIAEGERCLNSYSLVIEFGPGGRCRWCVM